jgi:hypothetical protein
MAVLTAALVLLLLLLGRDAFLAAMAVLTAFLGAMAVLIKKDSMLYADYGCTHIIVISSKIIE